MSFLDAPPIDWSRPEAQELLTILVSAYSSPSSAVALVQSAGVDVSAVPYDPTPRLYWKNIITAAGDQGVLRAMVGKVLDDAATRGYHPRIGALLEVASTGDADGGSVRGAVVAQEPLDPVALYDRLKTLLPAQFEEVVLRLNVPPHLLSGTTGPLGPRAMEVLRYQQQRGEAGLRALRDVLARL